MKFHSEKFFFFFDNKYGFLIRINNQKIFLLNKIKLTYIKTLGSIQQQWHKLYGWVILNYRKKRLQYGQ